MNLWTALRVGSFIMGWFHRAAEDGTITTDELIELGRMIVRELGLEVQIDVPPAPAKDEWHAPMKRPADWPQAQRDPSKAPAGWPLEPDREYK